MNNRNIADVTTNDSSSFKYKSNLLKGLTSKEVAASTDPNIAATHRLFINAQIVVPVKYLSLFFRTLEMPLVNCKVYLELNWTSNSIMTSVAGASTFQITSTKLYVPVVTLSIKDNVNLTKRLNEGFKSIGMNINQKQKQKNQMPAILKVSPLMFLFKELTDNLFLLLAILIMV